MDTLSAPYFNDPEAAREHLEAIRWPNGPVCPHCGETERRYETKRAARYRCGKAECRKDYSVTVGTLFEASHIKLNVWFKAVFLLCSSKKGMSSHQLHRMLGVTYKTAWFMTHRIREGMRDGKFPGPMGGDNKVVEVDETYVGPKATNRKSRDVRAKEPVVALVERDGKVRSFHVERVNSKTLKPILNEQIAKATYIMTDDSPVYPKIGEGFRGHGTVNHSIEEYVRGGFWHTNTVENYFSILKRGINGVYQHVSPKHLKRYVGEFDFRYNTRTITDLERTGAALKGIEGKRLTYGGSQGR